MTVSRVSRELAVYLLAALFLFLFFFGDFIPAAGWKETVPPSLINMNMMFISIFLEAIPFVLLGVFASACIQVFVSEQTLQRLIPRSPVGAMLPAALIGIIFPICECAIVPVVRRLIQKGMPSHIGVVVLASAPIVNPVVFASTYYAFQNTPYIAYARMGLGFLCAVVIGAIVYIVSSQSDGNVLKREGPYRQQVASGSRVGETLQHAADEFFQTGKYLLMGALIASGFQTFLDREVLEAIADDRIWSPLVMMAFGYVLSLCSEADAFIASSLGYVSSIQALLAFLIFGPVLDLKNTLMLFAYFKKRFVLLFMGSAIVVVYSAVQIFVLYGGNS